MQSVLGSCLALLLLAVFLDSTSNAAVYKIMPSGIDGTIRGNPLAGPTKFVLDVPLVAKVDSSEESSVKSQGVKVCLKGGSLNVSVGTPPQILTVDVDFWSYSYFHIYGADAAKLRNGMRGNTVVVKSYNGSVSSTFVNTTSNFTGTFCHGQFERDVVNISGAVLKNATMAVLHSYHFLPGRAIWNQYIFKDGVVGLHPVPSNTKNTFVESIVSQLDKPVVSYYGKYKKIPYLKYTNITYTYVRETPTITLGAEDSVNCNSDWIYVDRQSNHTTDYNVDISSISASLANGSSFDGSSIKINGTFSVSKGEPTYASNKIFQLLVNATNAKYNETLSRSKSQSKYVVDCDQVKNGGSLTINIGKDAQTKKKLVLKGTDLIAKYKDVCVLAVQNYDDFFDYNFLLEEGSEVLHVGSGFLRNRCLSKNIVTKEYGFASTKVRSNQPWILYW